MKRLQLVAGLAVISAFTGCSDATIPFLASISVQSAVTTVAAGNTVQFTAQGTFNDGTMRDLTNLVTWTAMAPVATIAPGGLAKTYIKGSTNITAAFNTPGGLISGTATLTVTAPALVSIVVTDSSVLVSGGKSVTATIAKGTTHRFSAYGIYSDGSENLLKAVWGVTPNPNSIASIDSGGVATGLGAGTVTINATDSATSISGSATLIVTATTLTHIVVSPVAQTIAPLTWLPLKALGEFSDNTTQDLTEQAKWSSTAPAVATIATLGPNVYATGVAAGSPSRMAAASNASSSGVKPARAATIGSIW